MTKLFTHFHFCSGVHALTFLTGHQLHHRLIEHTESGFALNGLPIPECRSLSQVRFLSTMAMSFYLLLKVAEYLSQPRPELNWHASLTCYPSGDRAGPIVPLKFSQCVLSFRLCVYFVEFETAGDKIMWTPTTLPYCFLLPSPESHLASMTPGLPIRLLLFPYLLIFYASILTSL